MYNYFDPDVLMYKHRDNCGEISNHIDVVDVVVTETDFGDYEEPGDNFNEPLTYICEVHMRWNGDGEVYVYPEYETEDPDDWDAAKDFILEQVA